ncbi:MAG: ABC transporter permease [Alphaproteobacteria bacterium]
MSAPAQPEPAAETPVVWSPTGHRRAALRDLAESLRQWRTWQLLAWLEIKQRYRRSTLGPLWLALTLAIQLVTMGVIVSAIFNHAGERFFPYLAAGLILWNLISALANDGAMSLIAANEQILNSTSPLLTHFLKAMSKCTIVVLHQLIVLVGVYAVFAVFPLPAALLALVTLPLAIVAVAWAPLILAVLSTRFRDIPLIVQVSIGVLFWLTPVMYYPEQLAQWRLIADLNPLTYVIAVVRKPLLGEWPSGLDWGVTAGLAAFGWTAAAGTFVALRHRIAYWL